MQAAIPNSPIVPTSNGGLLRVVSNKQMIAADKLAAEAAQNRPAINQLAGYIRRCFDDAKSARQTHETRMIRNLRQRRGEYDPTKLAAIRQSGGSEIFMMLTSVKCRAAASWLRDMLLGNGEDKPWTLKPTKVPSINPTQVQAITQKVTQETMSALQMGAPIGEGDIADRVGEIRDEVMQAIQQTAKAMADRMENQMDDQLQEGHFPSEFAMFLDDITCYPTAVFKGPVIRRRSQLQWTQVADGSWQLVEGTKLVKEWERVDPLNAYPARNATGINDGYFIEKHTLRRSDLTAMIGVPGYDDASIRTVLDEFGRGGLHEWTTADAALANINKMNTLTTDPEGTIDALQFWGNVSGKMLIEWGMDAKAVPDQSVEYTVEAWLIGRWVIKATINQDPMGRKPYFKASYEEIPGCWWGNSVADLISDVQDVCNAAARALVNNMGIASGPQVYVNTDRIPAGENITQMFPWKIWQTTSDPIGSTAPPIDFFQPKSNVQELVAVFDKFSLLADEYSGVPRYMSGNEQVGGAGRTASGLSMLINNASKAMKQVIGNIDINVLTPMLELLYYYNMRFGGSEVEKGDVRIIARGALALVAKEATQQRRNEFLMTTANPIDQAIMGPLGRAALLRESAKLLDMDTDKIIPSPAKIMFNMQQAQMQQQAQQKPQPSREQLKDGRPVTDTFSPARQSNP